MLKKPSGQDRTAAERNYVAKATRRRRRILQAGFFLVADTDGEVDFGEGNLCSFRHDCSGSE